MAQAVPTGNCGRSVLLAKAVPSRIAAKEEVVDEILAVLDREDWVHGDDGLRVRMALDEAITNAMLHGNRMDARKSVKIELFCENDHWGIIVEDEGCGFAEETLPDPDDPENLMREGGRGVLMMKGFMDEVTFLGKRNRVLMTRGRRTGAS